jgi:molecular chaperone GrpE
MSEQPFITNGEPIAEGPSEEIPSEGPRTPDNAGGLGRTPDNADQGGERDYLDDLLRLQAEFENFRKRTVREQTMTSSRATARFVERLLPVLDNFELALGHGEGGSGVDLVFKELTETLRSQGLEEIEAEGKPFDPQVHDAVESRDDPAADEVVVAQVYRRGYLFKGQLLRPAMVVVTRPGELETHANGGD